MFAVLVLEFYCNLAERIPLRTGSPRNLSCPHQSREASIGYFSQDEFIYKIPVYMVANYSFIFSLIFERQSGGILYVQIRNSGCDNAKSYFICKFFMLAL